MTAALTNPARIPFDYGLFYNAMVGLLGREPDRRVRHGLDGFYDNVYRPKHDGDRKKFEEFACQIRKWLDKFDITFSGSRVEYVTGDPTFGDHLRIVISHPTASKTTRQVEVLDCDIR